VAIFTGQILSGRRPLINGPGDQERDFVHVSDVAAANVLALHRGDGEILNIGSGIGTSVNTIYAILAELTGQPAEAAHGPAKKGEVYKIYLDADRASKILGWSPKTSLRDGLASTFEYFRSRFRRNES
jgi:UDP-glucose 4-epimerase